MIIVSGMIGAGKTTYAKMLEEALATKAFLEPVESNPILQKFYEDPKRHAFASQVHFLNAKFQLTKEAAAYPRNILDRSIEEDMLFAEVNYDLGHMNDVEKAIYDDLANNMVKTLDEVTEEQPTLCIFLRGELNTILSRIQERNRNFEQNDSLIEYYKTLHLRYEPWIREHYTPEQLMIIDIEETDILNPEQRQEIIQKISLRMQAVGL